MLDTLSPNRRPAPVIRLLEPRHSEPSALERIADSMSDGLLLLDRERRITYSSRRAGELLRIEPALLIGRPAQEVFAEVAYVFDNPSAVWTAWVDALARLDERPSLDLRVAWASYPDVRLRLFRVPGASAADDGIGLVIQDVSAEREVIRAKDEFVAGVCHELASPATNLVACAEMLCTEAYSAPERDQMLGSMVRESRRLMAIVRDFVDVQRVQQGRLEVHVRPTDVRLLMHHVATIARTDVAHQLVIDIPEHLPLVQADPERVQQVLANLVSNAQKYTPAGRQIELSARLLETSVEVTVADHGLGIPTDALARVFDRFYRVDADDRRNIAGSGLGLAIVKELVEAQLGEVGCSSAGQGQGARFWFRLPLAVYPVERSGTWAAADIPELAASVPAGPARASAERLRVLAVDDDRGVGAALVRLLRPEGHQIVAVSSGEEALQRLADAPFDVVISDLGLGDGMDGWELARRVRAEWPAVRFVLSSGSVSVSEVEARRLGADAILAKPYCPEDLRRVLLSYAARRWTKTGSPSCSGSS